MGYWDATDRYLDSHGGVGPTCPGCGEPMFPIDDHGRFTCFCGGVPRKRMLAPQTEAQEPASSKPVVVDVVSEVEE